ncbi:ABC transporter permease [Paludisphaera mucosa]|uniref:Transport permease protein n=1 Tax=Paludisphaera mucosa TaxID=3030827 RepID=A0ABT6F5M8_9BACT|nr:ABC transporter permease [Paludisphaera mucosa]MDG3002801.1 ABC transporter permease [Paludisphaera mucosa]
MDVCNETTTEAAASFPAPPSVRPSEVWRRRLEGDRVELIRFWPVVQNMVVQELRVRYQRSFMGFLWTLINPLLMMLVLSVVFSQLMRIPTENGSYTLFLLAGMVPWTFMAGAITESAVCIIQNEPLIRKIYVPKLVFPLVRVLINLVTGVLSLAALFILLVPLGARPSTAMLFLPAAIGLFFAFTLGLSLLVACANTFFRDCGHLVGVFIQAWYFATPIIYPVTQFEEPQRWRFWLNPAFYFIEIFHNVLCDGRWPQLSIVLIAAALATASLGIGYATFKSNEDKMVFRL